MKQLELFLADTPTQNTACEVPIRGQRGCHLAQYQRAQGFIEYEPRECRRRILAVLAGAENRWLELHWIVEAVKMPVRAVVDMLEFMQRWGEVESVKLYIVGPNEDPLVHPAWEKYRGFQYGYRLAATHPEQEESFAAGGRSDANPGRNAQLVPARLEGPVAIRPPGARSGSL